MWYKPQTLPLVSHSLLYGSQGPLQGSSRGRRSNLPWKTMLVTMSRHPANVQANARRYRTMCKYIRAPQSVAFPGLEIVKHSNCLNSYFCQSDFPPPLLVTVVECQACHLCPGENIYCPELLSSVTPTEICSSWKRSAEAHLDTNT